MARPKKDYTTLNMKVDSGIMQKLTAYCRRTRLNKTAAVEKIVSSYLSNEMIQPTVFPDIDLDAIAEAVGKEDVWEKWDVPSLFKAQSMVMDAVFDAFTNGKYKATNYKKTERAYVFKRFECYLAVYLQNGNVTYTVRLNTLNCQDSATVCYFSIEHMEYYIGSLLMRMLADFSELVHDCATINFTFEGHYKDTVPHGSCYAKDGGRFFNERETRILAGKHYYSGYVGKYNEFVPLPFDDWINEIKAHKAPDGTKEGE